MLARRTRPTRVPSQAAAPRTASALMWSLQWLAVDVVDPPAVCATGIVQLGNVLLVCGFPACVCVWCLRRFAQPLSAGQSSFSRSHLGPASCRAPPQRALLTPHARRCAARRQPPTHLPLRGAHADSPRLRRTPPRPSPTTHHRHPTTLPPSGQQRRAVSVALVAVVASGHPECARHRPPHAPRRPPPRRHTRRAGSTTRVPPPPWHPVGRPRRCHAARQWPRPGDWPKARARPRAQGKATSDCSCAAGTTATDCHRRSGGRRGARSGFDAQPRCRRSAVGMEGVRPLCAKRNGKGPGGQQSGQGGTHHMM